MKKHLYWVAVLLHPTKAQERDGNGKTEIIVKPVTVLASDEKSAGLLAARMIDEKHLEQIDRIEVAVSPFC